MVFSLTTCVKNAKEFNYWSSYMYQQFVFSKGTRQRMLILLQQTMGQQWSTTVQLSWLKKKNKRKRYLVTTDQVNMKDPKQDKFVLFWSSYSTQDCQKKTTPLKKKKTFGVTHVTCIIPLCYDHSHLCPLWECSQHLDKYRLLHVTTTKPFFLILNMQIYKYHTTCK